MQIEKDILGYYKKLDEKRLVYVGRNAATPSDDNFYLAFVNENEEIIKLRLSPEATAALAELIGRGSKLFTINGVTLDTSLQEVESSPK